MSRICDRYSRCKAIAAEHERCRDRKRNYCDKGDFHNDYQDCVKIGGNYKKPLSNFHEAIKIRNVDHEGQGSKRRKKVKNEG